MYSIRNTNMQKALLEQDVRIFRTSDLSVLWNNENKNTLWMTVSRYVRKHILYKIQRGLYSTVPLQKLDPYELGCAVCGQFSYVSAETVMQNSGIIMQMVSKITLFGKKKKEVEIGGNTYLCRYLNQKYLLNRNEIDDQHRYSIATQERAIADMLHINPKYYFDNTKTVDWKVIKNLSKKMGYKYENSKTQ